MSLLIVGLALWVGVHFIPSLAIPLRTQVIDNIGEKKYALVFSLLVISSIVIMVLGWRSIEPESVYNPPFHGTPVPAMLMLVTFILFAAAKTRTNIKRFIRHPQLSGLVIWSIAHLLANGDNRSLVLFGILGLWGIAEIVLISNREGEWLKSDAAPLKSDIITVVIGIVVFVIFLFAHPYLFGVSPIAQ